jgi:hypothetical protein
MPALISLASFIVKKCCIENGPTFDVSSYARYSNPRNPCEGARVAELLLQKSAKGGKRHWTDMTHIG